MSATCPFEQGPLQVVDLRPRGRHTRRVDGDVQGVAAIVTAVLTALGYGVGRRVERSRDTNSPQVVGLVTQQQFDAMQEHVEKLHAQLNETRVALASVATHVDNNRERITKLDKLDEIEAMLKRVLHE